MRKLTKQEYLALACRLTKAGCPLQFGDGLESGSVGLKIEQVGGVCETRVFDLDDGRTGYTLDLVITNDLEIPIYIQEFRLQMPWENPQFRWLEDPFKSVPRKYLYSFPGKDPLDYEREIVMNHRIGSKSMLCHGAHIDGLLLGIGPEPIPDQYELGRLVEIGFWVIDQRGIIFRSNVSLWVDRSATLDRRISKKAPASLGSLRSRSRLALALPDQPRAAEQPNHVTPSRANGMVCAASRGLVK